MRSIFKCGSVGLRAMTKKSHSRAIPQQLWVWVSSITRTSPISAVGSEAGQPLGWSGRRAAVVAIAREPSSKLGGEGHREEDAEEGPGRPLGQGGSRVDGERKDAGRVPREGGCWVGAVRISVGRTGCTIGTSTIGPRAASSRGGSTEAAASACTHGLATGGAGSSPRARPETT